jgi:hypothetical protein
MQFYPHPGSWWVHLAEVTFHGAYYSLPDMPYIEAECPPGPTPPVSITATPGNEYNNTNYIIHKRQGQIKCSLSLLSLQYVKYCGWIQDLDMGGVSDGLS